MQEGWTIDEVFVERGVSGSKPFGDREQGSALLARLQHGDVVVAAKLDRMFRSTLDASRRATASSATASPCSCWT